jgi:hypothetical protein
MTGRVVVLVVLWALGIVLSISNALAQAICAEVKIEIPQRVSLERQAFNARLGIENGIADPITALRVVLVFKDADGNPVLASNDPNNTTALFFFREDGSQNLTGGTGGNGSVAGSTNAQANWLIIPAAGAGGNTAAGKLYAVGAQISFMQGGQQRNLNVVPDTIVVEPQPLLKLDYFLPEDVYGDDPFTPTAETPEPFALGVRIKNTGFGPARRVQIETAQPRIVQNNTGLQIAFQIIEALVQNNPSEPTLLLNFGDLAPNAAKVGRWMMTVSLSGRFTEFDADFTHDDALGGALTSLISNVTTHTLVKNVLVDLPGRDTVEDFLARDIDTLRVYESNNQEVQVIDRSAESTIAAVSGGFRVVMGNSILPSYARVLDPTGGAMRIDRVARLGGAVLARQNVWLSKTRVGNNTEYTHYLNIYDPAGASTYTISLLRVDTASLAGLVFRDLNNNGTQETNERGIIGAPVRLTGMSVLGDTINRTLQTNSNGAFNFADLPAGSYALNNPAMPGLIDGIATVGSFGGNAAPGTISQITLQVNAAGQNYRFAKISTSSSPQGDLAVSFDSLSPGIGVGESLNVAVKVRHNGPDDAAGSVQLALPGGLTIASATTTSGTYDSTTRVWTLPTLVTPDEVSLNLQVRATVAGTRTLIATVSSTTPDPDQRNNQARLSISASTLPGELIFTDGLENQPLQGAKQATADASLPKPTTTRDSKAPNTAQSAANRDPSPATQSSEDAVDLPENDPARDGFESNQRGFEND